MIKLPLKTPLQPLLIRRFIEGLIVIGIIVGAVYAFKAGLASRQQAINDQAVRADQPQEQIQQTSLELDLRQRQDDINQIHQVIVTADQLGDVVSYFEQQASTTDIKLNVPRVEEVIKLMPDGTPIPNNGPVKEIKLTIVGVGDPPALLAFIHAVESSPYLATVAEWQLESSATQVPGFVATIPSTSPSASKEPANSAGLLNAKVIVTVENNAN